jgi:hypothetical protein
MSGGGVGGPTGLGLGVVGGNVVSSETSLMDTVAPVKGADLNSSLSSVTALGTAGTAEMAWKLSGRT